MISLWMQNELQSMPCHAGYLTQSGGSDSLEGFNWKSRWELGMDLRNETRQDEALEK